jgi:hypothetical protein
MILGASGMRQKAFPGEAHRKQKTTYDKSGVKGKNRARRAFGCLELYIVMEELLKRTRTIAMVSKKQPVRAVYPTCGFLSLSLRIA